VTAATGATVRQDPRVERLRVLIVDDDVAFAEGLELVLERDERIDVVARASNGAEALRLAREQSPDLILMDIAMPRMDGVSAARRLQKTCPDARVVMLTSSDVEADRNRAREAGVVDYLRKEDVVRLPETLVDLARRAV
jgi:DNA-binding NarL/FixJ family response regulator